MLARVTASDEMADAVGNVLITSTVQYSSQKYSTHCVIQVIVHLKAEHISGTVLATVCCVQGRDVRIITQHQRQCGRTCI